MANDASILGLLRPSVWRRQWQHDPIVVWQCLAASAVVALGLWLLFQAALHDVRWRAWAAQHCTITARESARTVTTTNTDGSVGLTTLPSRTTFACDDGVTYIR